MFRNVKRRNYRRLRVGRSLDALQDDTHMYLCRVCGFPCNSKKVDVAGPRLNASGELTGIKLVADADGDPYYVPTVVRGCPKCGTLYSKHKQ